MKMATKDTLYYELRDALVAGGCALCRQGRKASDSYFNALIYEGVTDRALREELRAAHGLCHRHAWRIAHRRGSVLGLAIVYQDVIKSLLTEIERDQEASPWWRKPQGELIQRLEPSSDCPACHLEREAERRTGKTLLKHLGETEIGESFLSAGGLCLPHFRLAIADAGKQAGCTLTSWQGRALRALHGELSELIRKHDYRFAAETIGSEADSWQRAVARVVGECDSSSDE